MKLVTIDQGINSHSGVLLGSGHVLNLVRLGEVLAGAKLIPPSVKGILEAGKDALDLIDRVIDRVHSGKDVSKQQLIEQEIIAPEEKTKFRAAVSDAMVISSGGGYRSHNEEMGDLTPKAPSCFVKNNASLTGTGQPIILPVSAPSMVDYEAEFCGVIGRPCHNVSPDEALDYVAGYTLINDVSARDWVAPFVQSTGHPMTIARAMLLNLMGKQLPTFCPLGPCIATKDDLTDPTNVEMITTLNGEVMQCANTSDLEFSLAEMISYFSRWYRFMPGDVISTGSPAGVGYSRNPQVFLKEGDVVEVSVEQIGVLRNPVRNATSMT